ncbi:MAG: MBL fold hydrolase [Phycisphaerae bacterium]|nr:MAG: MBL fold hydrolase [Phycisphaerae bacterium]
MFFHQRFVPGLAIYSYIVGDEKTGQAAVIDPTRDVDEFIEIAARAGLQIRHVMETHIHADFVSGSRELKDRLGDSVTIHASGMGGDDWTPTDADHVVKDGDEVAMGSLRLIAMHTPGHTLEHLSWGLFDDERSKDTPWLIFTGDFAFVGDVGRPDLLGDEARKVLASQLYDSVFNRMPAWRDFTEIFPGHGSGSLCGKAIGSRASSTVGYERHFNAALAEKPEQQWIGDLMDQMPLSPPYFARMKRINKEGPKVIGSNLPGQYALSADEVHGRKDVSHLVLDIRSKESFATAHIPGAISIPMGPMLPTWAGWILPYDRPILVVADDAAQMTAVATHLVRVGFDDIQGFLVGMDDWEVRGYAVESLATLSVQELNDRRDDVVVLDVRTESEWDSGHIKHATHVHGGTLPQNLERIPRDQPVAVICGSGYRGSIAASLLMREGFKDVANVLGGMSAWVTAGFAIQDSKGEPVRSSCAGASSQTSCNDVSSHSV